MGGAYDGRRIAYPRRRMAGSTQREGHFAAGDGLRALTALLILVFHGYIGVALLLSRDGTGHDFGLLGDVLVRLNASVYVFLVLSGYLVGGPFVRAWLRGGGYPRFLPYLGRRARRIVPAFSVVVPLLALWHGTSGASTSDVLVILAFGQVFLPLEKGYLLQQGWTLDVEVMFYLALPLVFLPLARLKPPADPRTRLRLLLGALAVLFVLGILWRRGPRPGLDDAGMRHVGTFIWAFVPGLLLAALEPTLKPRLAGTRAARAIAIVLGVVAVLSVVVLGVFELQDGQLASLLAYTGCGGGLVGGALVWQWATGRAPTGLDTRVARALGRWSYGLYLVQIGVGLEVLQHVPDGLGPLGVLAYVVALMAAGSIALAALLWWLVEQPILTRRRPVLGRPSVHPVEIPTGLPVSAAPVPSPAAK
jgi:peptidoglycan/LPS O-acetylase OafA/YrhL